MELKFLSIGRKAINFGITLNPDSDDDTVAQEERRITAHEAPLPELSSAFDRLTYVLRLKSMIANLQAANRKKNAIGEPAAGAPTH